MLAREMERPAASRWPGSTQVHLQIARGTMHLCGLAGLHRDAALVVADGAVGAGNQLPIGRLGVDANWLVASFMTVAQPLSATMAMAAVTRCLMFSLA
ncbi:hypothetical protein [Xanthomonas euvesicatoria]|uniref:Uncharacterized protein n=1 Tax=Xanthomonas euvesicatoria TaxID=456327 RepID=A0AAW3TY62_XANEU|nr:hypothetical protein [Xanthomonas euvesicatoria]MBB4721821.1 hypothetical protein [Xanthomonas euvesicatoria]